MLGSVLTIEEITGTEKRSITLVGPGLPLADGAEWKSANALPTEWNPGNKEATQQLLGPRELPSTFRGMWRRNMLARAPQPVVDSAGTRKLSVPWDVMTFVDAILRRGYRLRVTWTVNKQEGSTPSNTSAYQFKLVREGRAGEWSFKPQLADDIAWEIDFRWVSRGGSQQKVVKTRDADAVASSQQMSAGIASVLQQTSPTAPPYDSSALTPYTLGLLETFGAGPQAAIATLNVALTTAQSSFDQVSALAAKIRATPFQVANSMVTLTQSVMVAGYQARDTLGRMSPEQDTLNDDLTSFVYAATMVADAVEAARALGEQAAAARITAMNQRTAGPASASNSTQATAATSAAGILAIYATHDGDTFMSLSRTFYGDDGTGAAEIARTNGIPWGTVQLQTGTVLVIPVQNNSRSAARA